MKYIFLDVVGYSHNRTVEAQTDIVATLNQIVRDSTSHDGLTADNLIFLPTGDGICIGLLNILDPFDQHLSIALEILERISLYNQSQLDEKRRFCVRIGINENDDNLITDINGNRNVAGSGINFAQRVMDAAGASQIFVSEAVHDKLVQREKYYDHLTAQSVNIKHGLQKELYRYLNRDLPYLDSDIVAIAEEDMSFSSFSAVYAAVVFILDRKIVELSDGGMSEDVLFVLLCYMADDIVAYRRLRVIERPKFSSKVFGSKKDSFATAFAALDNSPSWVLFDCKDYLLEKRGLAKWDTYFRKEFLFLTAEGKSKLDEEKPKLIGAVEIFLKQIYPNIDQEK